MIDTIKCKSELDLTEAFFKKLLLGAIDKSLDHKKMEDHDLAKFSRSNDPTLPHRPIMIGKGKERQWSDDETLIGSSSRWNSVSGNRASTTLHKSPTSDARHTSTFGERHSPVTGNGPPSRRTTFHDPIQEAEDPEPRLTQRSSTIGSHVSSWWKREPL